MVFSMLLATLLTPVIWYALRDPFSAQTWKGVVSFFTLTMQGKLIQIHLLFAESFGPGPFAVFGGSFMAYGICNFVAILPAGVLALMNPHDNISYKEGMAGWADDDVLTKMEAAKKVGIKGGFAVALGRWPSGKRKGGLVQLIETLSTLCLAPPGTGKTTAFIVPTIVTADTTSFIVNDPKPELWAFTSHYRASISHVFMLNWSNTDQPNYIFTFNKNANRPFWEYINSPDMDEDSVPKAVLAAAGDDKASTTVQIHPGDFDLTVKWLEQFASADVYSYTRPTLYPRFNFLSPRLVPPIGPARDTYLDAIAQTLISADDKKGGDSYFVNKGRAALTGFMHLIVAKVGDARNYDGIPANWIGMEPSLPMLNDWLTISQFNATGEGQGTPDGDPMMTGGGMDPNADKLGEWIRSISNEIKVKPEYPADHPLNRGKSERGFMELATLINMADKERSGIIGTMDEALIPFKNAAVKQRTSACDFTGDDMRGILDPSIQRRTRLPTDHKDYLDENGAEFEKLHADTANWKPVTLYVCINQADAPAFAKITALLYQVLSRDLLSYRPRETNIKTGVKLGPTPTCFSLDEFAKLPKITAIMEGPDLGRSMKTMYQISSQDFAQIEKTYTKEDIEVIISTTAVKLVFSQNNPSTIERIQKMVGKTTIRDRSRSGMEGLSKQSNPLAANVSEQTSGVNFLRNEDVAALPDDKVIVLVQNFLNRPMRLDAARYFEDPILSKRVYPGADRVTPGTVHPRTPSSDFYLPQHLYEARLQEMIQHRRESHRRHIREDARVPEMAFHIQGQKIDVSPQFYS
ncbi:type IV secretory system conjugative DNA transfer family protein [Camelimonas fluminis]|uniref:Type IV secretory system conjugative DNA transfer family protein n=1 Tax=Camelimonas fluminis TaxID=1576911 RepID=A0ABV7UJF4_9HYPH|nr:type IV secretory system conjugative DNA transfer family protein [Camelimonas fluminis]